MGQRLIAGTLMLFWTDQSPRDGWRHSDLQSSLRDSDSLRVVVDPAINRWATLVPSLRDAERAAKTACTTGRVRPASRR